MPPSKKEIWAKWDKAWDLKRPAPERLTILQGAVSPDFKYVNPMYETEDGEEKLENLVGFVEMALKQNGNNIKVKHLKWWEHHEESGLQWDMIIVETGDVAIKGMSWAKYDRETGLLINVSDFW